MPKTFISLALILGLGLQAQQGDQKGHSMKDLIPVSEIPAAPALDIDQALKSFKIQEGFQITPIAAEPQVHNPVAMVFDGNGRLWVCEMSTYMPNVDAIGEDVAEGNITVLEDTNGDGKLNKRTVFLDDVILPRTVAMVKGGILYADHTKLYFAEVLDDLKVGIREVIDPTYAQGGNLEHKPNSMLYSLDGWYYNSKSNKRYKTLALNSSLPNGSKEIYRNKYWKLVISPSESRGQWGLSMDDYGRLFHNGNSSCATGEVLMPNQTMHNPKSKPKHKSFRIGQNAIYPIRINPGINRGYMTNMLHQNGPNRGKLKSFTAASGNTVYRGDQFPEQFYGSVLTPEPAGNLISIRKLIDHGTSLSGKEIYPQSELLASTDERFRPVNLFTAPDGSLYILDLYHGILQHKTFVTSYLRRQILSRGLDKNNNDRGRIYRLSHKSKPLGKQPKMLTKNVSELIPHLAHPNGWWRDTARRLIAQSQDKRLIPAIQKLYSDTSDHRFKVNILWTLKEIDGITAPLIASALNEKHPKVAISGIILLSHLDSAEQIKLFPKLNELAASNEALAIQVIINSGQYTGPEALHLLNDLFNSKSTAERLSSASSGIATRTAEMKSLLTDKINPSLLKHLDSQSKNKVAKSNSKKLPKWAKPLYKNGEKLYKGKAACFGCHGQNGEGIDNMGPPLAKSEWVTDSPERLIKVMLHGLSGPITVNKKQYTSPMIMPGLANNPSINDEDLASIATYIRNNWGNKAGAVKTEEFIKWRQQTKSQALPYTAKDFE